MLLDTAYCCCRGTFLLCSEIELELEHMYGQLEKVLEAIKYNEETRPFLLPVTEEQAPDYAQVIAVSHSCSRWLLLGIPSHSRRPWICRRSR